MADADSKTCRVCGETFPLSEFHRNPKCKDGHLNQCRSCHNKASNARYHRTKTLRPLSPTATCEYCGKEFARPQPRRPGDPPRVSTRHCSLACRLWSKVDRSGGPDACWNWKSNARSNSGDGYGVLNMGARTQHAMRVAWEITNGPIPKGLLACHKCDNKLCCNPAHIFLGTHLDNMQDMRKKGRHPGMSPDGKRRLIESKKGKPRPPEVIEKVRQGLRAHYAANPGTYSGRKHSEATKQKLRDAWVLRKAISTANANQR